MTIGLFGAIGTHEALSLGVPAVPGSSSASRRRSEVRPSGCDAELPITLLHVGSLYAVAAAAGTLLLVVLAGLGVSGPTAAIAGVVITTAVRLLAVRFDWSFPAQQALVPRSR